MRVSPVALSWAVGGHMGLEQLWVLRCVSGTGPHVPRAPPGCLCTLLFGQVRLTGRRPWGHRGGGLPPGPGVHPSRGSLLGTLLSPTLGKAVGTQQPGRTLCAKELRP